jgi:HAD superfamily hydrolase (TIGR01509 family)
MPTVLLDIDGTLIDSNEAHARAWVDAFAEYGITTDVERVVRLIGMGGDKLLPTIAPGLDTERGKGKEMTERRKRIFKERYLPTLRPFPRVRALLERMRDEGLTLVVATSAGESELGGLLDVAGVADLLDATTNSDDAENSKPDPDIVQAALRRAKARPEETLMLGDTPYDVEAAGRAGVGCVAVRSGGWDDAALRDAVAVYADAAALLDAWDDSPIAALARTGRAPSPAPSPAQR